MRKILISLMAASMFVPATAYADDRGLARGLRNHAERSSERDKSSDDRSSRSQSAQRSEGSSEDRPARAERAPRSDRPVRVDRLQRIERADGRDTGAQRIERVRRADRDEQQVEQVQVPEQVRRTRQIERRREGLAGGFTQIARDTADGRTNDRDNDRDWRRDRDNDRDWRRDRDGRHDWSRDWRNDRRYDWSNHRSRYRSLFRLGRYYDPYSWGYRRFSIGYSLWPNYYGSNYWLNDPWTYRLPPAYGPYRWVRYYDDAVLVNIYTGRVADVIHNFFW